MPRNYDEMRAQRDLDFTICGETFHMQLVPHWKLTQWMEREQEPDSQGAVADLFVQRMVDVLGDNGQAERWIALQKREDGPTMGELTDLMRWIMEEQTGLPTEAPSPSGAGRTKTPASSKGTSS